MKDQKERKYFLMGAIWSRLQKPSSSKDQKNDIRSRGRTRTRTRTPPSFKEDNSVKTHSTDPIDMTPPANTSVPNTGNNHQHSKSRVTPHEFVWKNGGNKVSLTGSFDGWSQNVLMARDQSGSYRATVNLREDEKQLFKFVVDGVWRCSLDFPCETDEQGNVNNVLYPI